MLFRTYIRISQFLFTIEIFLWQSKNDLNSNIFFEGNLIMTKYFDHVTVFHDNLPNYGTNDIFKVG